MEKIKLFVLAVNIWDADDYLNDRNTNPKRTDLYLYTDREKATDKANNLDIDNDIYNVATIYEGELSQEEILQLTRFEDIADFNEALEEPYSVDPRVKNFGEFEKTEVAMAIMENPTGEESVECANYDFEKSLEGAILVFWSWQRYIGYARKCLEVRRAHSDDTEKILLKQDMVFATQCDILLTAEEVNNADNLQDAILEELAKSSWKWTNPEFVKNEVNRFE